jgi:hypothetical protein
MFFRPRTSEDAQRVRVTLLAEGVVAGVGFLLLFVGARVNVVLAIVGVVLVCLGAVLGLRAFALARGARSLGPPRAS